MRPFDDLIEDLAGGADVSVQAFAPHLAESRREDRLQINRTLADALLARGRAEDLPYVQACAHRAWLLSRFHPGLLPWTVATLQACGDVEGIRGAYKRAGFLALAQGDLNGALSHFNDLHYAWPVHGRQDRFEYDFEVMDALQAAAGRLRNPLPAPITPGEGPLRVGYLLKGLAEHNSILIEIFKDFARHHDRSGFQVTFYALESEDELGASLQGAAHARVFDDLGYPLMVAPRGGTVLDRTLALTHRIREDRLDVLLMSVALADYRHFLVTALRPAPAVAGFIHGGAMALFAPPTLDWTFAWPRACQIASPCDALALDLEIPLPDPTQVQPLERTALGLPPDAVLLVSGGRAVKYQDPRFWQVVDQILTDHPGAHLVVVGAAASELPPAFTGMGDDVQRRVTCLGWRNDHRRILRMADLVLDTFPMAGGVVPLEALAMGVPVVSFRNDAVQTYDQSDASGLEALVDLPELLVPRGDLAGFAALAGRLIADPEARQDLGERARQALLRRNGQPARMVRACEDALRERLPPRFQGAEAFACRVDLEGEWWPQVVMAYLGCFKPGDPVRLLLCCGTGSSIEDVEMGVAALAEALGLPAFADILLPGSPDQFDAVRQGVPSIQPLDGPADLDRLTGPGGRRLARALAQGAPSC